jgi:DMSO/TMAO reductase YedYZ molybdopterin-dependent catalytic subunit
MITRRQLVLGSAGSLVMGYARGARAADVILAGHSSGDALLDLVALSGKQRLVRRTFRPPNFETPLADLRTPVTSNAAFFVRYHLARIPRIDSRHWRLHVNGSSARHSLDLSLAALHRDFERVSLMAVNQCAGNRRALFTPRAPGIQWHHGAMGNAVWTGARLRDVLRTAGIQADALEIVFNGADSALLPATPDFVKSLPIDRALDENTLIAYEMNGTALPHWNGAPARLVVPGWTGTYWMKHLTDIRIESHSFDGFWMKTAYRAPTGAIPGARFFSQETTETMPVTEVLVNSLVTSHAPGDRIRRGESTEISGWGWDAGAGIAAVEISKDGRQSWEDATLEEERGRFAWRGFRWRFVPRATGPLYLSVRARSRSGSQQPEQPIANASGYHHNAIQTLALEVI